MKLERRAALKFIGFAPLAMATNACKSENKIAMPPIVFTKPCESSQKTTVPTPFIVTIYDGNPERHIDEFPTPDTHGCIRYITIKEKKLQFGTDANATRPLVKPDFLMQLVKDSNITEPVKVILLKENLIDRDGKTHTHLRGTREIVEEENTVILSLQGLFNTTQGTAEEERLRTINRALNDELAYQLYLIGATLKSAPSNTTIKGSEWVDANAKKFAQEYSFAHSAILIGNLP